VARSIRVKGVSYSGIDEWLGIPDTVAGEFVGHGNVDDVGAGGIGRGESTLDGGPGSSEDRG
jgi:hypothetical protein